MQCYINGNQYTYTNLVRDDDLIRNSFNKLAQETFKLDLEPWYQSGFWGSSYLPHVLLVDQQVVANVSVNVMNFAWEGQARRYIQLGTIMTDNRYRGRGLARYLMNRVIQEWGSKCDTVYLFAHDGVVDFYPRFGFVKAVEHQYGMPIRKCNGAFRKLDMTSQQDRELLLRKYSQSNPFSALSMEQNSGLVMLYCSQFMRNSIYYVDHYDAVVIAEHDDTALVCYDIFCEDSGGMQDMLSIIAAENTETVLFGFTPKQREACSVSQLIEADNTLFVLGGKENIFADNQVMFPLLSRA